METELKQLFEAAKKAADAAADDGHPESSPEEDRCIDALKALKKFPVNYQVLVSTQVDT
ncbi:putative transcription factor IIS, TFIIS/LEDGF domain superfamily [Helianthus debilis subsp. tardiflorus]